MIKAIHIISLLYTAELKGANGAQRRKISVFKHLLAKKELCIEITTNFGSILQIITSVCLS